jgi:hypothetical protein
VSKWEDISVEVHRYSDTGEYDFQETIGSYVLNRFFSVTPPAWRALPHLHEANLGAISFRGKKHDQATDFHQDIYRNVERRHDDFLKSYREFIHDNVEEIADEEVVFQRIPTFRVHPPGETAISAGMHKDSDFGHTIPETRNLWVPLTDAFGTNALHIKQPHDDIPRSIPVSYQNFLLFNAVDQVHGNVINETEQTRVSFDARIIPKRCFRELAGTAINSGLPFKIGDDAYYTELTPFERMEWSGRKSRSTLGNIQHHPWD